MEGIMLFGLGGAVLVFCLQIIIQPGEPYDPINQHRERD